MKILHVVFALETGGAETMLVDVVNEQSKHERVELLIVNNSVNGDLLEALDRRIAIHYLARRPGSLNPFKVLEFNFKIFKINPDIIHFHDHKGIRLLIKYNVRANTFLTIHDVNDPVVNLQKYDKLISISGAVQRDVLQRAKVDSTKIYNGIDFSKIKIKSHYKDYGEFKIIQVSRLHHEKKGQHVLFHALHKLIYQYGLKNVKLQLIGEGRSFNYLSELSKELDISQYIEFLGNRDRNYIYNNLKYQCLLVQPSIYEGFGLTVVEGIAAGLPIIVSNVDGPAEIVEGLPSCLQFEPNNAEALSRSILRIKQWYSEGIVEERCKKSYSIALEKFSIRKTSLDYIRHYKQSSKNIYN